MLESNWNHKIKREEQKHSMVISEILSKYNIETYVGNKYAEVNSLNFCDRDFTEKNVLSFATSIKYVEYVRRNKEIIAFITNDNFVEAYKEALSDREYCIIIANEPERLFYEIHEYFVKENMYDIANFEPVIGNDCDINHTAYIDNGVIIGNNVRIGANAVVYSGTVIEDNVKIGCGAIIGGEGFQAIQCGEGEPIQVSHIGGVHICRNVYVGDNTCIAKSLFKSSTYIGEGTKIDNLVNISHNVRVGSNSVITGHTMIAGSVSIGDNVWIAPNCTILNRISIGDNTHIGIGCVVSKSVPNNSIVRSSSKCSVWSE